jgi:predicted secreted protein
MSSNAIAGVGTQFMRGDGASAEQFTAIAEINSIEGPGMTRETIDVTSLDSTGGYREYIAGFRDGGNVVLNMNFTHDGYLAMLADYEDDISHNYQIIFDDGAQTTIEFAAWVTDLPLSVPTADKVTCVATLKVTGALVVSS